MSLTPMSPSEFQSSLNKYLDFHRTYLFRVMFFDGAVNLAASILTTELISSTDTPVSTTTAINLGWQGSKIKLPGKTDYTDWKVTIRDDATNVAYTFFQDWRTKVYNLKTGASSKIANTGVMALTGLASGYKKSAIVMLLTNKVLRSQGFLSSLGNVVGQAATIRAYILNGIWPKEVGAITLDYSNENIVTFPVTFSMDFFEPYSALGELTNLASNLLKL